MQVTQKNDLVTHANISGAKAIDFTVDAGPEMMHILSTALYTDQILAVVRETLCNAWDAHVEFGCTDIPVEVKLSDTELTIRDFGPGIPQNMIGPIYGTYGGSTKAANGQVTGGFGLGCKSPFAYTDYFDVTSWSKDDGKMTVYSLSKSNAEVGGKPSILPIVSVPTQEHGLEVKIMLKTPTDRARFRELIQRIAKNGQMNMKLNNELIETIPFDTMKHNFMLTTDKVLETTHHIMLRYGNVVYPIESDERFMKQITEIADLLNHLPGSDRYSRSGWKIIFQAKPNTISVTPSREALSMQKHTVDSITELFKEFLNLKDTLLKKECFNLLKNNIQNTYLENTPKELFETKNEVPFINKQFGECNEYGRFINYENQLNYLIDFPGFVKEYSRHKYPEFDGYRKQDILLRINNLIMSGHGNKKAMRSLRREFYKLWNWKHGLKEYKSSWFHKDFIYPIIHKMNQNENVRADKLFIYGEKTDKYGYGREMGFHNWKTFPAKKNLADYLPFLRNHIILSFNRQDIDRAIQFPVMKHWLGEVKNSLVYIVPRADQKVEAARAFFKSIGMYVVDLTLAQKWEHSEANKAPTPEYERKPRKNGIPLLSQIRSEIDGNAKISTALAFIETPNLTKEPEFIVKFNRKNNQAFLDDLSQQVTDHIVRLWGDKGAIVVNQNQMDRYLKAGAVDMKEYVLDKCLDAFQNNKNIIEFLPFDYSKHPQYSGWGSERHIFSWFPIILGDPDLAQYFGIVDNRTKDEIAIMEIYNAFKNNYWRGDKKQYETIELIIKNAILDNKIEELRDLISKSKMISLFEQTTMDSIINHSKIYGYTDKQRLAARDMLLNALES